MIGDMNESPGGQATPGITSTPDRQSGPDPRTALFLQALLNPAGIPDNSSQFQPEQNGLLDAISRKLNEGAPVDPMGGPSMPPMGPPPVNDLASIIPPNPQGPPMPPQGSMGPSPMPQQPMPQDVPQAVGPPQPPQMMAPGISGKSQATGAYGQPIPEEVLNQFVKNPDILTQMMMGGGNGQ